MRSSRKPDTRRSWRLTHSARAAVDGRLRRLIALVTAALAGGTLLMLVPAGPAAAQLPPPAPGVTMSAAAQSASVVYVAYTSTFGDVILRNVAGSPQNTIALGGSLVGGPALAVAAPGVLGTGSRLVVFGRGTDNALWWTYQTATGQFTGWRSLGGRLTSKPAAATNMSNEFGALNVFARGTDGALWYRVWGATGWKPWTLRGSSLLPGTGPNASGSEVAFARPDRRITVLGRTGMANGFVDFGGRTTANPGITDVGPALPQVVVFARGLDNALWYKTSPLPLYGGFAWHSLGGRLTSGVTATTVPIGKTYVFALGTDNQIWMRAGVWPALGGWTRP